RVRNGRKSFQCRATVGLGRGRDGRLLLAVSSSTKYRSDQSGGGINSSAADEMKRLGESTLRGWCASPPTRISENRVPHALSAAGWLNCVRLGAFASWLKAGFSGRAHSSNAALFPSDVLAS